MRQTKEVILNLIVQWEICLWLTACDFGDSSFKPVNVAEISPWFRWKCSLPELNRLLMFPSGGRSHPRLLRSKFYLRGKVNLRKTVYIKIFFFFLVELCLLNILWNLDPPITSSGSDWWPLLCCASGLRWAKSWNDDQVYSSYTNLGKKSLIFFIIWSFSGGCTHAEVGLWKPIILDSVFGQWRVNSQAYRVKSDEWGQKPDYTGSHF